MSREDFERSLPGAYFLDPADGGGLEEHLHALGWLATDEPVRALDRAGEGNMNLVLRVRTDRRSLVLKQARPWVERYPSIAAPDERALVEAAFYEAVARTPAVARRMPRLLAVEPAARLLAFEDLGEASDLATVYAGRILAGGELDVLVDYLVALHGLGPSRVPAKRLANRAMRALNHEHLFRLPLAADNGLDLDAIAPGLAPAARALIEDRAYVAAVSDLGQRYLGDGRHLLHGDFYPGSWVEAGGALRVIDPEFCFLGPAELDVAMMVAHLLLAAQPVRSVGRVVERYRCARALDEDLLWRFAGVEVMRRLIGVAQLPLSHPGAWRARLLELSRALVLFPEPSRILA